MRRVSCRAHGGKVLNRKGAKVAKEEGEERVFHTEGTEDLNNVKF
jgi:hypothetical protein